MPQTTHLVGVDGCERGWIAVCFPAGEPARAMVRVFATFAALLEAEPPDSLVAVDMPIGLPERTIRGGREPDWAARQFLGPCCARVFPVPSRAAVFAPDYRAACEIARKTSEPARAPSKQVFHIFPRIREIDILLRAEPPLRARVFEVHPEIAFALMNGGSPLAPKKVKGKGFAPGLAQREALLRAQGFDVAALPRNFPRGVGLDDLFDACACAWTAFRILRGEARVYPESPGRDAAGLPIAIRA